MLSKGLKDISKYMSLILRHKPEVAGITLDEHGWADVNELIKGVRKKYSDFCKTYLDVIVKCDEKQRYSFNEDRTKIRANQGHSIPVDVELKKAIPPDILYHGTSCKNIYSIKKNGLIPMSRLYVHLSGDVETALDVAKRRRTQEPAIFKIYSGKMHEDGYEFYLSENGVWLTKEVPAKYLKRWYFE